MSMLKCTQMVLALTALLALGACGGSGFAPSIGPFEGTLSTQDGGVGTFSFTILHGDLAGSGTMVISDSQLPIAVAGFVVGSEINATISNAENGSGTLSGSFNNAKSCSGDFQFATEDGTVVMNGTWIAAEL